MWVRSLIKATCTRSFVFCLKFIKILNEDIILSFCRSVSTEHCQSWNNNITFQIELHYKYETEKAYNYLAFKAYNSLFFKSIQVLK